MDKLVSVLLLCLLIGVSCSKNQRHQNARFVNGIYDEVLTAFPSLEVKYTYVDSTGTITKVIFYQHGKIDSTVSDL